MKKHLFAALTAFCCATATFSAIAISAEETTNPYLLPNDLGYYYGFMVQTDGTELTEDMIPFKDDAMYSGIRSWSVVGAPLPWGAP